MPSVVYRVKSEADFKLAAAPSGIVIDGAGEGVVLAARLIEVWAGRRPEASPDAAKMDEECLLVCEEGMLTVASGTCCTMGSCSLEGAPGMDTGFCCVMKLVEIC